MCTETHLFVSITAQIGVIFMILHIFDPTEIGYDRFNFDLISCKLRAFNVKTHI